jgi:hypothetical protein
MHLLNNDRPDHVWMDRAEIFIGSRLIEGERELIVGVERLAT